MEIRVQKNQINIHTISIQSLAPNRCIKSFIKQRNAYTSKVYAGLYKLQASPIPMCVSSLHQNALQYIRLDNPRKLL